MCQLVLNLSMVGIFRGRGRRDVQCLCPKLTSSNVLGPTPMLSSLQMDSSSFILLVLFPLIIHYCIPAFSKGFLNRLGMQKGSVVFRSCLLLILPSASKQLCGVLRLDCPFRVST